jgi:hypothetical protein
LKKRASFLSGIIRTSTQQRDLSDVKMPRPNGRTRLGPRTTLRAATIRSRTRPCVSSAAATKWCSQKKSRTLQLPSLCPDPQSENRSVPHTRGSPRLRFDLLVPRGHSERGSSALYVANRSIAPVRNSECIVGNTELCRSFAVGPFEGGPPASKLPVCR